MWGFYDQKLMDALKAVTLTRLDQGKIFHTNYSYFDKVAVDRLFNFYSGSLRLFDDIENHVRLSTSDKELLEGANQALKDRLAGQPERYGIIIEKQGPIPIGKGVILGAPVCGSKGEPCTGNDPPSGWQFKLDTGAKWNTKRITGDDLKDSERVIPLDPWAQVLNGAAMGARRDYDRRMRNLANACKELKKAQKELLESLTKQGDPAKKVFAL
jgi:hypothetical protein